MVPLGITTEWAGLVLHSGGHQDDGLAHFYIPSVVQNYANPLWLPSQFLTIQFHHGLVTFDLTFARWDCRLFLASVVSDIRLEKHTFTLLNWFHISLQVALMSTSISSLSRLEEARWLCECRMLSSENLDHDSGSESLDGGYIIVSITINLWRNREYSIKY